MSDDQDTHEPEGERHAHPDARSVTVGMRHALDAIDAFGGPIDPLDGPTARKITDATALRIAPELWDGTLQESWKRLNITDERREQTLARRRARVTADAARYVDVNLRMIARRGAAYGGTAKLSCRA